MYKYFHQQPQSRLDGAVGGVALFSTFAVTSRGERLWGGSLSRDVAQLVARHVRDVEVGSSSLLIPTQGDRRSSSAVTFFSLPFRHRLAWRHRRPLQGSGR